VAPKDAKAGTTAALHEQFQSENNTETSTALDETALLEHPSYKELQTKLTETEDKVLRVQAEMSNMLRRAERDVVSAHKYALEKFIAELLPVVDSFERAVVSHEGQDETESNKAVLDGINLTLKMLYTAFEKFGIQQINPLGEAFNPELHQAVSTEIAPRVKPGNVANVLQKGYILNNRLVRPALVTVAKAE